MKWYWRWLIGVFTSRRRRRPASAIEFVPTKIWEVDAELDISKRAREQGAAGLPSIMDTQPDFMHKLIRVHFHQKLWSLHTDVQALADHYDRQFAQLGIESIPKQVRSAPDRFQQLADSALTRYRSQLQEFRVRRDNAKQAYHGFKKKYGAVSDAEYPESKFGHFAFPFLLLVLEALFNSYVFAGADPTGRGVAGGIRIALIIALINVVIAVLIGNSLRNLNSKDIFIKLLGALAACVAVVYAPLNLFWAHYRDRAIALKNLDAFSFDELIKLRMKVLPDAWDHFVEHPLAITSIESWGLFALGCVVVGFALLDGYAMSDPIPGFERRHRALLRAQAALERLRQECISLIEGAFSRISDELRAAAKSYGSLFTTYDVVLGTLARLETVYGNQARDYVESYDAAIALYRAENRVQRQGAPTPDYFNRSAEPLPVPPFPADLQAKTRWREDFRTYSDRITTEVTSAETELQARRATALRDVDIGPTERPNGW
ncbi:MAG: hypothetical protein HY661_04800 [Betaproteobacteria bacterium]|nr:hypothetical protein [Betaproteobacteria bacterium]